MFKKYLDLSVSILTKFLHSEERHERYSIKKILGSAPEESLIKGDVLGPLEAVSRSDQGLILRANNIYFSRFRTGDQVDVVCIDPANKKFKKISSTSIRAIRFPNPGVIEVVVPGRLIPTDSGELFLMPQDASGIKGQLQHKLKNLEDSRPHAPHFFIETPIVRKKLSQMNVHLNSTQRDALKFLIDNDFKGLIQGPPGTGKTSLLVSLVRLLIESGVRVGLASFSHSAIDNALGRILNAGVKTKSVARVARHREKIKAEHYIENHLDTIALESFKDASKEVQLFAASMHTWSMNSQTPEIDVLIIDESSQVPIYFYAFLSRLCSRVIMFGDHKQLPPVIQVASHELPAEDIFSYQITQNQNSPMLEVQYRMNQGVQEWSSQRFYQNRLKPHESNCNRDVLKNIPNRSGLLGSNVVNMISHTGTTTNFANPQEAKKVVDLVWALKTEGHLPLDEIGIVAPYRAHAGAICAELQQKLGVEDAQKVLVDTVERFQGQEREAMIFSIGADRDEAKSGDRVFLGDGRRLNVAVTRAKSRFYCFAPQKLVDRTLSAPGDEDLKSMLEWCGAVGQPAMERIEYNGYTKEKFDSGHEEYEHRAVAENILGRRLASDEVVHHINGRRYDNRPENLCVMSRQDHNRYHDWYEWYQKTFGRDPWREAQLRKLREKFNGTLLADLIKKTNFSG